MIIAFSQLNTRCETRPLWHVAVKQKLHFLVFIAKMLFDTDHRPSERKKNGHNHLSFLWPENSWIMDSPTLPAYHSHSTMQQCVGRCAAGLSCCHFVEWVCVMDSQPFWVRRSFEHWKICSMRNDHERIAHRHFGYSTTNINISPRTEHIVITKWHLVAYDVHISFYRLEIVNANSFSDKFHFIKSKDAQKSNKYPCVYWSTFWSTLQPPHLIHIFLNFHFLYWPEK